MLKKIDRMWWKIVRIKKIKMLNNHNNNSYLNLILIINPTRNSKIPRMLNIKTKTITLVLTLLGDIWSII